MGLQQGLAGEESGLFYHAVRIIQEMRCATKGEYPVIAVWENVLGAFSSNNRMDFRAVLESFADTEIPMPTARRWTGAGMVRGGAVDIAWRVMDARYWGVPPLPQRRRRIFLVADFTGQRTAEILFKSREVYQTSLSCTTSGNSSTAQNRILAYETGRALPVVHPFQYRRMRGCAKEKDQTRYIGSFGRPTDPFPTLLTRDINMFSLWYGDDYKNGILRSLTPTESERLMGLPEGWTEHGHEGEKTSDGARYKALGNAIALPCAEYIMSGIQDVLKNDLCPANDLQEL